MRKRVIVNSPFKSTWASRDIQVLQEKDYDVVTTMAFAEGLLRGGFRTIWLLLRYRRAIWIHQSAGHASVLACLVGSKLGHKNIIIAVGADSACFPEIDYGFYRKWTTRLTTTLSLRYADLVCPVHKSMELYDYTFWNVKHKTQGIKAFVPSLRTPFFPIENGFDDKKWQARIPYNQRKFDAIAVFAVGAKNRGVLKGADLILSVAERNPTLKFKIIGKVENGITPPSNCAIVGNCTQVELESHYNDAKIILQPSITEGFPNTLGEAMACGCYPIGSRVSSIPDIISGHGLILNQRDEKQLEALIQEGLQNIEDNLVDMQSISDSIFQRYPLDKRKKRLLQAIDRVSS